MWSDNETTSDFLNFRCVADTAAEMIVQAQGRPLSMGVSGGWGVGKSSMLKLISKSLESRCENRYLFVNFNAWLYQGYDDSRAALMDVIARKLIAQCEDDSSGLDRAKDLLRRVNWLRIAGLGTGAAASFAAGVPPLWLLGPLWSSVRNLGDENLEQADLDTIHEFARALPSYTSTVDSSQPTASPPRQIHDLRQHFEDTLRELDITLVVFIDDLDRCLPATAIATLEAVRLFLFLPSTAFVIAADDEMIRQAVGIHFGADSLDETLITNYFDKLVQVPIRVPPLGTQEVRAYLMLLFIENSELEPGKFETIRERVCNRLSESWKGHRVDLRFVLDQIDDCPDSLRANLELSDRLSPLLTTARQIAGNPRIIKRFLNTLAIRMSIARSQNVSVDEAALAKMLLFERCAEEDAYTHLISAINESHEGKPSFLVEWEMRARAGEEIDELPTAWDSPFIIEWLALAPAFADMDLRPVVYVSREHMPIVTSSDQLSSQASDVLEALLAVEAGPSNLIAEELRTLTGREVAVIRERLMVRARQEQEWGTPQVLWALLTVIDADEQHASSFAQFLESISPAVLQPDIVPVLHDRQWAMRALTKWRQHSATPQTVQNAINSMARDS